MLLPLLPWFLKSNSVADNRHNEQSNRTSSRYRSLQYSAPILVIQDIRQAIENMEARRTLLEVINARWNTQWDDKWWQMGQLVRCKVVIWLSAMGLVRLLINGRVMNNCWTCRIKMQILLGLFHRIVRLWCWGLGSTCTLGSSIRNLSHWCCLQSLSFVEREYSTLFRLTTRFRFS
jgi:hypothetical protein